LTVPSTTTHGPGGNQHFGDKGDPALETVSDHGQAGLQTVHHHIEGIEVRVKRALRRRRNLVLLALLNQVGQGLQGIELFRGARNGFEFTGDRVDNLHIFPRSSASFRSFSDRRWARRPMGATPEQSP
jgi:hypothetical protein